jgi:flagellar protein FliO/FliZ
LTRARDLCAALVPTLPVLALAFCLNATAAPDPQAPAAQPNAVAAQAAPASTIPAPAANAAQAPAQTVATPAPMPATPAAGSLLQTTLALVFVLALLAALAWFMKRYGPKASGGAAHLRVVGALSLGGRERIMVVEVGDQWIVVGASPGRVNALATMPRQAGAEPSAVLAPHLPPAAGFADWLKQTIDKRNAK